MKRMMLISALSLCALPFFASEATARSRFHFSFSFGNGGGHYYPYYYPRPYARYYGPVYPGGVYYPGTVLGYRYYPSYRYRVYRLPGPAPRYYRKTYGAYQPRRYHRRYWARD